MNPSIDPSLQNPTQPPSSTEATAPESAQAIPPSSHPSIDSQNALAPTPTAPAPQPPLTVEKQASADVPQPAPDNQNGPTDRQLNVTDALSYLDAVKIQFHDRPDVYNVFLDIMKDFKSQVIDTPGVIQRVATLFHGHPFLIQGFNTFLPVGYRIEVGSDSQSSEVITVTTPSGTMLRSTNTPSISVPPQSLSAPPQQEIGQLPPSDQPTVSAPLPSTSALGLSNTPKLSGSSIDLPTPDDHERQVLGPAMEYVQRIKTRFSNDPDTYKQFLEILSNYKSSANNAEVVAKVEELFKDAPDLSSTFLDFLPGTGIQDNDGLNALRGPGTRTGTPTGEHARVQKRKQPAEPAAPPPSAPAKRRRKAADRDKEKDRDSGRATGSRVKQPPTGREPPAFSHFNTIPAPPSPRRSGHAYAHHAPPPPAPQSYAQAGTAVALPPQPLASVTNLDETQFFPRVKAALDSRETYHEFLKLVNLFTQDFIDRARLIRESRSFLGEGELMVQLKEILGWDETIERSALAKEREEMYPPPGRPLSILDRPCREELNIRYGSYRRLPADDINIECSGRDEMCKSVLNDEWVSHPSFSSEDSVFMAHKKNLYEEALHRTEEERHEYDFHIDALVRTIGVLEPLNHKIMAMNPEERTLFRLKPNFGGAGKAVHQRIIKKIYGREAGLEVLQAMQDTPALALSVVLARLKQKEVEWKRAQREWNKIWRAVDVANYARSLDHQGITSKTADKKALTAKAFVAQIEAIMETQMARRAALVDPLYARARPQHQLEYEIEDQDVLRDALKLAFAYLARLGGTQLRLDAARKGWVETRLYSIVRAFFQLNDWDERPSAARPRAILKHASATATVAQSPNAHSAGMATAAAGEAAAGSEDADSATTVGGSSTPRARNGALPANFSGDLRKSLLKSEQAKLARANTHPLPGSPSPQSSRKASPVPTIPTPAPVPMATDDEAPPPPPPPPVVRVESNPAAGEKRRSKRRSFFTNTWFYTLLRMVEVLYSRLHLFKNIAVERVNDPSFNTRPSVTAMDLELLEAGGSAGVHEGQGQTHVRITALQYYELMLETCERLFDNQIEQLAFEDQMREMFGLHDAYKIFTIDKVLASLIKHVQSWEQDPKLEKITKLLWDERRLEAPTVEDHRAFRQQAEGILGPEENLFRVDWLPESKMLTFQLLSKDGSSLDDAEVLSGRWQAYVDGFVSETETPGVPTSKVRRPFLRRSLPTTTTAKAAGGNSSSSQGFYARGGLEIKVCVRTYRLFYVSRTEDVLWRVQAAAERERAVARLVARDAVRARRLEKLITRGGASETAGVE
ncbi:hypothetical protein EDB92DRAFT_541726 [Lactarius akahatsu]|uniref:VHS domain-containing protein n=1 Tax=Lactarius akahatsu TaxID=416441 RepID=A0AAD4LKR4_9AGAM|nr:hypothetical protein EDB92DRAFT_541726 [Lactarius akahatsu]